jgi:reductive dehalogenase
MVSILIFISALALILQALIGLTFLVSCIWEKEKRASVLAALQFLLMLSLVVVFFFIKGTGFLKTAPGLICLVGLLILGASAAFLLVRKSGLNPKALDGTKGLIVGQVGRFDEREQVFARNRALRPGSKQYQAFYEQHPEYEAYDAKRREAGGPLGRPGTLDRPHEGPNVAATMASVAMPLYLSSSDKVKPQAHQQLGGSKMTLSPEETTERVKGYTLNLGADLVGITEVNPPWVYSHRGEIFRENWEDWGKEISVEHKFAVVFAMEMSFPMVGTAPHTPTAIESMNNYAKGAYIATQLASFMANLGYSSTASHLRHYEALLVPMAVDAGLGELGRHGYLITKGFGSRVRLGAVTTDLPLISDKSVDIGVENFCTICRKCALCCPSGSIPSGDRTVVNGTLRWKLNAETCFEYWGKIGTDCNICMRVCPWSHARTFPHKVIVELVTRNSRARRLFSVMDDIFYGRKPRPKTAPKWAEFATWV